MLFGFIFLLFVGLLFISLNPYFWSTGKPRKATWKNWDQSKVLDPSAWSGQGETGVGSKGPAAERNLECSQRARWGCQAERTAQSTQRTTRVRPQIQTEDTPFPWSTRRSALLFNSYKYLLSPCHASGAILSICDMEINKRNRVSAFTDHRFLWGEGPRKDKGS